MKKALLVGINYISLPDISLYGCIDDVVNMRNLLIDAYDYLSSDITILRDDDPLNLPTVKNILEQLDIIASQSGNLDEIWIHYSGHGSQINNPNSDQVDKLDSILVPLDYQTAGFIGEQTLLSVIQKVKCRGILLFDSCHSGSICDLPYSIVYTKPGEYKKQVNNNIVVTNPNIFVFSGSKRSQTSSDTYSDVQGEPVGAFTNAFIECLRESRHNIEILTLYNCVCENLANGGFKQVPVLSSSVPMPMHKIVRAQGPGPVSVPVLTKETTPVVQYNTAKQTIQTILSTVSTGKKGKLVI